MTGFVLDDFLRDHAPRAQLLERCRDGDHDIEVREQAGLRWFTVSGAFVQSMMRVDMPDAIVVPNQLGMLSALAWRRQVVQILNLGSGSGAFERFLRARRPAVQVTSVELSARIVAMARTYFAWPAAQPVVIEAAADYVAHSTARFDIVLCDIFDGEQHPECLFDPYFHRDLNARLRRGGVLALNLSPSADDELTDILVAVRQAFEWVLLAPVADHGNIIVLAAAIRPPPTAEFERRLAQLAAELGLQRSALASRIEYLPSRREVLGGSPSR
ncbi:MAG: fused MFS/spermidine synthase [Gammaproteobacteria bacterium]